MQQMTLFDNNRVTVSYTHLDDSYDEGYGADEEEIEFVETDEEN